MRPTNNKVLYYAVLLTYFLTYIITYLITYLLTYLLHAA